MSLKDRASINGSIIGAAGDQLSQIEIEPEVDPDEGLNEDELKVNNEKLREQVQDQVRLFEQYLKVAVLQQEQNNFKAKLIKEKKLHSGNGSMDGASNPNDYSREVSI